MAHIEERKIKSGTYFYLIESSRSDGKVKHEKTYLGTKCPLHKSRGWTYLSPGTVDWLKERAGQKTKPIKTLPSQKGKYKAIVIDPPWPMERIRRQVTGEEIVFDYPTMTISQIRNDRKLLPIRRLIDKSGCMVFLWTTQKHLPISYDILKTWGINYLFTMVWDKGHGMKPFNLPVFNCEFVVVGTVGKCDFVTTKNFKTLFDAARRNHSQKPKEFYQLLKRVTSEPRIDMFSREKHKGFDQYGNETDKFQFCERLNPDKAIG